MQRFFARLNDTLARPVQTAPRLLILGAALLLVAVYILPLWNLTMFAPQYPDGLRLDIYSYKLEGGNHGQDVREINILNHYIGMRPLDDFTEFGLLVVGGSRCSARTAVGTVTTAVCWCHLFLLFALWRRASFTDAATPCRPRRPSRWTVHAAMFGSRTGQLPRLLYPGAASGRWRVVWSRRHLVWRASRAG
jgi:hypothetical protein